MNPNQIIQYVVTSLRNNTASVDALQILLKNHGITKIQMLTAGVSNEDVNRLYQSDSELHLSKIQNGEYSNQQIKSLIDKNEITEDLLLSRGIKSKDEMNNIMERPVGFHEMQFDFGDVPDLQENRTDIFVFGVAGSGKSSFMAGLMYYTEKFKGLTGQVNNPKGFTYMYDLINSVQVSKLPPATDRKYVQYMECDFTDDRGSYHPLTFMEMSGELFSSCFGKSKNELDPKLNRFLFNSPNNKIIFLTIDYKSHLNGTASLSKQGAQFVFILQFLAMHGMMSSVEAICILITKWDSSSNRSEEAAKEFLKNEYFSLYDLCKKMEEQYQLNFRAFCYSLGEFNASNQYTYDSYYSSQIHEFLINASPIKQDQRKPGFWRKVFG